jgi:DNA repair protein RadC
LIALLIQSGTKERSAVDLGRDLLHRAGPLHRLAEKSVAEVSRVSGIGSARAAAIVAAIEIGRRVQRSNPGAGPALRGSSDVAGRIMPILADRVQETFLVLVLDARNALRAEIELTRGTISASMVHPREVFKAAIDHLGSSVIVAHNHPSGNPDPSQEDIEITRQLVEAGKIVGIPLLDHLIIAGRGYRSMADMGLMPS